MKREYGADGLLSNAKAAPATVSAEFLPNTPLIKTVGKVGKNDDTQARRPATLYRKAINRNGVYPG